MPVVNSPDPDRWRGPPKQQDAGGQPPYDGSMEARVTAIENHLDRMDERLTRVVVKIDHIEKEVGQTKWWILGQIVAGLLAVLGTSIAIQQMTVTTFQAASEERAAQKPPAAPTPSQTVQPIVIQLPPQQPAPAVQSEPAAK